MFWKKKKSERCTYLHCRKFLKNDYLNTGMCTDCTVLAVLSIKKYFKVSGGFTANIYYIPEFTKKVRFEEGIHYKIDYSVKTDGIFYGKRCQSAERALRQRSERRHFKKLFP